MLHWLQMTKTKPQKKDLDAKIAWLAEDGTQMTMRDYIAFVNYELYDALPANTKEPKLESKHE